MADETDKSKEILENIKRSIRRDQLKKEAKAKRPLRWSQPKLEAGIDYEDPDWRAPSEDKIPVKKPSLTEEEFEQKVQQAINSVKKADPSELDKKIEEFLSKEQSKKTETPPPKLRKRNQYDIQSDNDKPAAEKSDFDKKLDEKLAERSKPSPLNDKTLHTASKKLNRRRFGQYDIPAPLPPPPSTNLGNKPVESERVDRDPIPIFTAPKGAKPAEAEKVIRPKRSGSVPASDSTKGPFPPPRRDIPIRQGGSVPSSGETPPRLSRKTGWMDRPLVTNRFRKSFRQILKEQIGVHGFGRVGAEASNIRYDDYYYEDYFGRQRRRYPYGSHGPENFNSRRNRFIQNRADRNFERRTNRQEREHTEHVQSSELFHLGNKINNLSQDTAFLKQDINRILYILNELRNRDNNTGMNSGMMLPEQRSGVTANGANGLGIGEAILGLGLGKYLKDKFAKWFPNLTGGSKGTVAAPAKPSVVAEPVKSPMAASKTAPGAPVTEKPSLFNRAGAAINKAAPIASKIGTALAKVAGPLFLLSSIKDMADTSEERNATIKKIAEDPEKAAKELPEGSVAQKIANKVKESGKKHTEKEVERIYLGETNKIRQAGQRGRADKVTVKEIHQAAEAGINATEADENVRYITGNTFYTYNEFKEYIAANPSVTEITKGSKLVDFEPKAKAKPAKARSRPDPVPIKRKKKEEKEAVKETQPAPAPATPTPTNSPTTTINNRPTFNQVNNYTRNSVTTPAKPQTYSIAPSVNNPPTITPNLQGRMGSAPTVTNPGSVAPATLSKGVTGSAKEAMDFFISKGWTPEQAAGIVGNLIQESQLYTGAHNTKENAQGIAQWRLDRLTVFEQVFKKKMLEATFKEQLEYVHYELTQGVKKGVGERLRLIKNEVDATHLIDSQYEVSAGTERAARIANAKSVLQQYKPNDSGATPQQGETTPAPAPSDNTAPSVAPPGAIPMSDGTSVPSIATTTPPAPVNPTTAPTGAPVAGSPRGNTVAPAQNVQVSPGVDVSKVNPKLMESLNAAAQDFGQPVQITSAYRDDKKQAELWVRGNILKEPGIFMPAKPQTTQTVTINGQQYTAPGGGRGSSHATGEAVDVAQASAMQAAGILQKHNLTLPFGAADPVHIQLAGSNTSQQSQGQEPPVGRANPPTGGAPVSNGGMVPPSNGPRPNPAPVPQIPSGIIPNMGQMNPRLNIPLPQINTGSSILNSGINMITSTVLGGITGAITGGNNNTINSPIHNGRRGISVNPLAAIEQLYQTIMTPSPKATSGTRLDTQSRKAMYEDPKNKQIIQQAFDAPTGQTVTNNTPKVSPNIPRDDNLNVHPSPALMREITATNGQPSIVKRPDEMGISLNTWAPAPTIG